MWLFRYGKDFRRKIYIHAITSFQLLNKILVQLKISNKYVKVFMSPCTRWSPLFIDSYDHDCRKTLGIRREMCVSGLARLIPTECEVGGWPPLSVTFQTEEDRREVLSRAAHLVTDRRSNIQVILVNNNRWCPEKCPNVVGISWNIGTFIWDLLYFV